MYCLFLVTLHFLSNGVTCSITIDYYEKLIQQNIEASENYKLPESNEEFKNAFQHTSTIELRSRDFIIIGSGSAGSVLATRLSEIDDFDILLLEAGREEDDFNKIPSMYSYSLFSDKNWGYYTTEQKHSCLGAKNRRCFLPRGKVIGGSSSINGMMYVRGNAKDFDNWAELGNPGWAYEDVLPYFLKSENSQINGSVNYHGKGGFWNVEYAPPLSYTFSHFIEGSLELNLSIVDFNGFEQLGVNQVQFNTKRGVRQSTGTAFLDNARKRRNLEVITGALATKIIVDNNTKTATGVEFVTRSGKFKVKANKEVISSAGAFNSPQLLMLSGIGPRDHLEEMGIEVVADLPVGKNLLDHPALNLIIQTNYTVPNIDIKEKIKQYLNGIGPLTKGNAVEGVGFIYTGNKSSTVPTIEFIFQPTIGNSTTALSKIFNYNDDLETNFIQKINPTTDVLIYIILLHQKSEGRVTLNSTNPADFPNIDSNMLSEQEDVDTLIEGIDFFQELLQTEALKQLDAKLLNVTICTNFTQHSKAYWECLIRQAITGAYHPCGTTAMGPDSSSSVVDHNLKVHGIKRLRVVDAGVMPALTSGHLNAPTVMIAEKISDQIKTEYGYN